jgi:hypothetical protein
MENITLSNEVKKAIAKNTYYSEDNFINDAKRYIEAIKEGRVIVSVVSVAKSGMSRRLKVLAYQKHKDSERGYYRQFNAMFEALGYKIKDYAFTVNGCGMDMIFHTNYSAMHSFKFMGIITDKDCDYLAQQTPTNI